MPSERNYWIDVLKIFFTIEIVLFHASMMFRDENIPFSVNGAIGVEFFFLVSGWLLFYAADRKKNDCDKSIGLSTRGYVLKRYLHLIILGR